MFDNGNQISKTHGMRNTPEYNVWHNMKKRCLNETHEAYQNYGGRGITVCERWMKFENFFEDMGRRPSNKHSLERKDNDGNYEPSNCKWATKIEQSKNRRTNRVLAYNGISKTIGDWERELGFCKGVLITRLDRCKWPIEKALNTPIGGKLKISDETVNEAVSLINSGYSIQSACDRLNVNYNSLYSRLRKLPNNISTYIK